MQDGTSRHEFDKVIGRRGPVSSYNEWDPLEEVIVGVMCGAAVPEWNVMLEATMPEHSHEFFRQYGGKRWPEDEYEQARHELDGLARVLEAEGVRVVRPDVVDHARAFSTPNWSSRGGLYAAMPRDLLLVVGDTIIEAPMAWRSRYFETDAYRNLLKEYFRRGARWIAAPKPQLLDSLFRDDFDRVDPQASSRYVINETEPTFDAADFIRCGRDIVAQKSHVTNMMGIEWVRRHIGPEYNVHVLEVSDSSPMHIDASFMPLAPGKLLLNRHRVKKVPALFRSWEVRYAPEPALPKSHRIYMSSAWVSMNVLMLNERTVVVEAQEAPLIDMLTAWNLRVIPVPFRNVMRFGGAFHCVTADVRRTGTLQSYV